MEPTEVAERLQAERRRLEGLRQGLDQDDLRGQTEQESLAELSSVDQHPADSGTETFNRERDLAIGEQVEAELDDVEAALERLENGTYGTCEACGQPIEEERLEALPATRFCLTDQGRAEREAAPGL
jgi:RNA polymerase-binding transcription factor DksA